MKNQYKIGIGVIALIVIIVVAVRLFGRTDHSVETGYNKLVEAEAVSVSAIEAQINAIHQEELAKQQEEQKKKNAKTPSKKEISSYKKVFENSVVMGDSIVEGLSDFKCLYSSSIVCHRGWSVAEAKPMVSQVVKLQPANIFMSFGVNDLPFFRGNAKNFRKEYKKRINEIKSKLPNAKFYINGILPVQKSVLKSRPVYKHIPEFNEQLKQLCQEMGIVYIDNSSIVESLSNVYETDGIHMYPKYYPHWLRNMAEKAGLL